MREHSKLHPGRLTWNIIPWRFGTSMFLSKWLICRFHVHLPGCIPLYLLGIFMNSCSLSSIYFFLNLRCGPRSWKCKDLHNIARQLCLVFGKVEGTHGGNHQAHQAPGFVSGPTGALPNKTKGVNGTKSQQSLVCGCLRCRHQKDTNKNGCSKTNNSNSMQANCVMGCSVH